MNGRERWSGRGCVAMAMAITLGIPMPAHAWLEGPAPDRASIEESDPVVVLDFESSDASRGASLAAALRVAVGERGLGEREALTLGEVARTTACDPHGAACIAAAGRALYASHVVWGSVEPDGGVLVARVHLVDVSRAEETAVVRHSLGPGTPSPADLHATAEALADDLFPDPRAILAARESAEDAAPSPPPPPLAPVVDEPVEAGDARSSTFEWERRPHDVPRWKWAMLGTSIGVTAVGVATAVGASVALKTSLHKQLLDKADASLKDSNPANDIDAAHIPPGFNNDICSYAREVTGTAPNGGPAVRNAAVTRVCTKADGVHKLALGGIGVAVAGLVGTAVFTTLLFVHLRGPRAAALRRRNLRLGAGPLPRGGMAASASWRF